MLDFSLTEELRLVRDTFRRFAAEQVASRLSLVENGENRRGS
jgi:hypothetical protein